MLRGEPTVSTTQIFYYFCESCGGDTASYDKYDICPYCHADRGWFQLLAESSFGQLRGEIRQMLEQHRAEWITNHKAYLGVPSRRRRLWVQH